jgi:hypothetical protein
MRCSSASARGRDSGLWRLRGTFEQRTRSRGFSRHILSSIRGCSRVSERPSASGVVNTRSPRTLIRIVSGRMPIPGAPGADQCHDVVERAVQPPGPRRWEEERHESADSAHHHECGCQIHDDGARRHRFGHCAGGGSGGQAIVNGSRPATCGRAASQTG